jgi:hypothetical protein
MEKDSEDNNFGMALQLKDLFWSAESFDAGDAMEAALAKLPPDTKRQSQRDRLAALARKRELSTKHPIPERSAQPPRSFCER